MKYLKKALKWFVNILTTLLLILLALVVYGKASMIFKSASYPSYFGYTMFSIASGSMEPTLYVNDVVLVKINSGDYKVGDVITYIKNKDIITHRIISISNNTLTVKGDANNTIDDPITKDQIIGKVVKTYPKLSVWQKVLTEPKILVAIFITFLLFDFAISYKGKDNKKEEKKEEKEEIVKEEIKVEEIKAEDTKEKEEKVLEATMVFNKDELKDLYELEKAKEENKKEKTDDPLGYTVRLDLNEINKRIKSKVK